MLVFYDTVYDLNVTDKWTIKRNDKFKKIANCQKQTLKVTNYVFCFDLTRYYLLGDFNDLNEDYKASSHKINELFIDLKTTFNDEIRPIFIFDYNEEKFVIMTKDYFYLIFYEALRVDLNSFKLILNTNYDKYNIVRYVNCLLKPCTITSDKDWSEVITKSSDGPDHREERLINNKYLQMLLVLVIFLTFVILIAFIISYITKTKGRSMLNSLIELRAGSRFGRSKSMRNSSMRNSGMRSSGMRSSSMRTSSMRTSSMKTSNVKQSSLKQSSLKNSYMSDKSLREIKNLKDTKVLKSRREPVKIDDKLIKKSSSSSRSPSSKKQMDKESMPSPSSTPFKTQKMCSDTMNSQLNTISSQVSDHKRSSQKKSI